MVTGSDGLAFVVFRASSVAGPVEVRASSEGATDGVVEVVVGVGGLMELPEGNGIALIGETATHPENHWGTTGMVSALQNLGVGFLSRFGKPIEVNDMSLPLGGLFDLGADWQPPHVEHRVGLSADLRTSGRTPAELRFIQDVLEELGGGVHDETRAPAPHYHLRMR